MAFLDWLKSIKETKQDARDQSFGESVAKLALSDVDIEGLILTS